MYFILLIWFTMTEHVDSLNNSGNYCRLVCYDMVVNAPNFRGFILRAFINLP